MGALAILSQPLCVLSTSPRLSPKKSWPFVFKETRMAPKKREAATNAPASTEPAARHNPRSKKPAKTAANRKKWNETKKRTAEVRDALRKVGQEVAAVRYAPPTERFWRKPPVEWSDELGEDLYILFSTGHGMNSVAKMDGMPSVYQMMKWLADESHAFSRVRARALEHLVPYYEELAKEITLTANPQTVVTRRQVLTKDGDVEDLVDERVVDNVERSKLAFMGLQWTLGHLKPKKHGRAPDSAPGKNEQLEGLFAALKAGPK